FVMAKVEQERASRKFPRGFRQFDTLRRGTVAGQIDALATATAKRIGDRQPLLMLGIELESEAEQIAKLRLGLQSEAEADPVAEGAAHHAATIPVNKLDLAVFSCLKLERRDPTQDRNASHLQ